MIYINFNSEDLVVDWMSFNLAGLTDLKLLAQRLLPYFNVSVVTENQSQIYFSDCQNSYNVLLRQCSKTHWIGTQIIFSGKNGAYFYKLIKTQNFDWNILKFDDHFLSLSRVDLCFSRSNDLNHTSKLFDSFLVDSRSQIQNQTTTRHIKLQDFPDGKILKINRRNNSVHYRVYQKEEHTRFEIEFKHRQTKLVQNFLFQNKLELFEDQLARKYFQYSERILCLDYPYTNWILNFQRKYQWDGVCQGLVTSYLEKQLTNDKEEEERLFHLFQFLSFIHSLGLTAFKGCQKHRIKKQLYYDLKFSLSEFIEFTGMKISKQSQRDKLIRYFKQLQKLDPIVKEFSDKSFQSYICFPYVGCQNSSGNSWTIEIFAAQELFCFKYPFQVPKSFLTSTQKNDLRLKFRFITAIAVPEREKVLNLDEFFNMINVPNKHLIKIKKNIIQLLNELVVNRIIKNKVEITLKSGKKKSLVVKDLTASDITRRIQCIKFDENIKNLWC